jgi:hypothetical protein
MRKGLPEGQKQEGVPKRSVSSCNMVTNLAQQGGIETQHADMRRDLACVCGRIIDSGASARAAHSWCLSPVSAPAPYTMYLSIYLYLSVCICACEQWV